MATEQLGKGGHLEHVEADAVCEQCSTVNPPDTLLCKTCGNNLRDQRMRRLAMDTAGVTDRERPRRLLTGLLTVLGLLSILWVALNVGSIENRLIAGFEAAGAGPNQRPENYWTGADADLYEALRTELDDNPLTQSELFAAGTEPQDATNWSGRYVLKLRDETQAPAIGQAVVRDDGETVRFVARLSWGGEIRGAAVRANETTLQADPAGVEISGKIEDAYGVAKQQRAGVFQCIGALASTDSRYVAFAYRIPKESPGA